MSEIETPSPTEPLPKPEAGKRYGGRNELLAGAGHLKEAEVEVGNVTYLVRELTGAERARVVGLQASARIGGKVEMEKFEKALLLHGLCDPESPEGARTPALVAADLEAAMQNGSSVIEKLTDEIAKLSGLTVDVEEAAKAEDFSGAANGSSTSGSRASLAG